MHVVCKELRKTCPWSRRSCSHTQDNGPFGGRRQRSSVTTKEVVSQKGSRILCFALCTPWIIFCIMCNVKRLFVWSKNRLARVMARVEIYGGQGSHTHTHLVLVVCLLSMATRQAQQAHSQHFERHELSRRVVVGGPANPTMVIGAQGQSKSCDFLAIIGSYCMFEGQVLPSRVSTELPTCASGYCSRTFEMATVVFFRRTVKQAGKLTLGGAVGTATAPSISVLESPSASSPRLSHCQPAIAVCVRYFR